MAIGRSVKPLGVLANMTRPDRANSVRPWRATLITRVTHWNAVVENLKLPVPVKLRFPRGLDWSWWCLQIPTNGTNALNRRSVSGGAIVCTRTAIALFSWSQRCATSSAEAEYVAMGDCVSKEALFVPGVLAFLQPQLGMACIRVYGEQKGGCCVITKPLDLGTQKAHS